MKYRAIYIDHEGKRYMLMANEEGVFNDEQMKFLIKRVRQGAKVRYKGWDSDKPKEEDHEAATH